MESETDRSLWTRVDVYSCIISKIEHEKSRLKWTLNDDALAYISECSLRHYILDAVSTPHQAFIQIMTNSYIIDRRHPLSFYGKTYILFQFAADAILFKLFVGA